MTFTFTMPKLSPTMESGVIAKWHKKVGDKVEPGDLIIEVSTDKATVEHNALDGGFLRQIIVPEGGEAKVNEPIAILTEKADSAIEVPEEKASAVAKAEELPKEELKPVKEVAASVKEDRIKASPLAKKIAEQQNIDLRHIEGTGPSGRIVKKDLEKASSVPKPVPALPKEIKEEPLSPIRKVIAKRLQEAKNSIPHFYVTMEVYADALVHFREQLSHSGYKVSFNDLVVKAAAIALRSHPQINSGFNDKNQTIIRYPTIDISVAVSVDSGLITPIVNQADHKTLSDISAEIRELVKKAKEGKLRPEEFQGGSFTISNLGMYGVSEFQAIINPPQAAILAVSGILDKPIVKNGKIEIGKTLNLTLSVDHRVIDGVAAAEYLKTLQKILENPITLVI